MTTIEQALLDALKQMEAAVAVANTEPKPNLMALADALPTGTDGELQHYLEKKSYEKARLFLEGRFAEIKKGGCLR